MRADAPPAVDAGGTPGELGASSNGASETVAEQLEAQQAAAASAAARASQAYDRRVQVRGASQACMRGECCLTGLVYDLLQESVR